MIKYLLFMLALACAAADYEYEFLTPSIVVIKAPGPNVQFTRKIIQSGVWQKENALKRDRNNQILRKPDICRFEYHIFETPFKHGEKATVGADGIVYNAERPSSIFKLNQVGNGVNQKKKYAYMGMWLGSAGALPLKGFAGKPFEIRRSSDHKVVFKNTLKLRQDDPNYQGHIPFTGEEVLTLDYSEFNTPGDYYFHVDKIGRSHTFSIGPDTIGEAFYIHARGLYHKRCGIAKKTPYTHWVSPTCHDVAVRGRFPGNADHYRRGKGEKEFGFFDRKDNRIEVKHFDLIKQNPPYEVEEVTAPGGWHDAADYDRRPFHLRIVSDLAMVYLMKPENFVDGQLNIPESGNGIPDILDEAAWGLKHLLASQQEDGGVGTWFETIGHPGPGEGLPDEDKRVYYISAPSRNGTLEYAATASTLALAMKKAGAASEAENYWQSAQKAWRFASNPKKRHIAAYQYNGEVIFYREEVNLNAEHLVKYALNWYLLTGDMAAQELIVENDSRLTAAFRKDFWRWSPLTWLAIAENPHFAPPLAREYRTVILRDAGQMLLDQENAYPYRTLWHASDAGWVHAMAWGNYHPLRRALTLIAAHKLTGEAAYLDGVYLANDFHNGANPLGRSMTSGLGKVYPAVFLDLVSYADGIGEFVPGITPYGNTFGLDRNAVSMVYRDLANKLPIFRRHVNLDFLSVPSSEYSVWETIAPAAVTTGYLIEKAALPCDTWKDRKPIEDFRKLPGYLALP